MVEEHPVFNLFVTCVFFAAASSATMAATTPMLETTTDEHLCYWNRTGIRDNTNQSCYLFVSERTSFRQANRSCVDEGAHLVSIGNQSENTRVSGLTQTDVWIGLYRLTNETCAGRSCTTWMWLDGSGLEYDAWTTLISATTIQCVFMATDGTWEHVRHCSRNQSFVCEKSIPPSTTPEPTMMAVTSEITDTSLLNSNQWMAVTSNMTDTSGSNSETDHFSIFLGVGVFVGIFVIAFIVGAVCLMKRKHGRKVKTCKVTADKDIGNYENVGMSVSSHGPVIGQHAPPEGVYVNSITTDTIISTRNHEDVTCDRPSYEEVTPYSAVSPEYTPLQFTGSTNPNVYR